MGHDDATAGALHRHFRHYDATLPSKVQALWKPVSQSRNEGQSCMPDARGGLYRPENARRAAEVCGSYDDTRARNEGYPGH